MKRIFILSVEMDDQIEPVTVCAAEYKADENGQQTKVRGAEPIAIAATFNRAMEEVSEIAKFAIGNGWESLFDESPMGD